MARKDGERLREDQNGSSMTGAAARRFIARWRRYNAWQHLQFESLAASQKLRQCEVLRSWASTLGKNDLRHREEQELRHLWGRIRRAYRERS